MLLGDLAQSAQKTARMSGRGTGGEGRRWECGVRSAVATQVKHRVQRWVCSPCLSQLYPCGVVVPHTSHVGEDWVCDLLWASSDVVRHCLQRAVSALGLLECFAFQFLAAGRVQF